MLNLVSKAITAVAKGAQVAAATLAVSLPAAGSAALTSAADAAEMMANAVETTLAETTGVAAHLTGDLANASFPELAHAIIHDVADKGARVAVAGLKGSGLDPIIYGQQLVGPGGGAPMAGGDGGASAMQAAQTAANTANMNAVVAARIAALQAQNN